MSKIIPKRSTGGCLTCKRRRKKCDERRPYCRRCEMGDFHCLGYDPPDTSCTGGSSSIIKAELIHRPPYSPISGTQVGAGSPSTESLNDLAPLPEYENEIQRPSSAGAFLREIRHCLSDIPQGVRLDPTLLEDMIPLILSRYVRISQEVLFKASLLSVERGLLHRINHSDVTRWSMYLGARVMVDLLDGGNAQKYLGWILRFCRQITETSTPNEQRTSLEGRLHGLYDLIRIGSMVAGTMAGYSLLRRSTPVLLQLAALEPKIWVHNSSISIPEAFRDSRYEIVQFVVHDTITSLALGIPPQLYYDTTSLWVDKAPGHYMEWIHGFPISLLILLAEINAWRASRMMGEATQKQSKCHDIEKRLNSWDPIVDHTDEPSKEIARLAIQEAWRQATLIYLYMGMSEVNSADPRIERAVQQIVQLGLTIATDSPLEMHLTVPCLIAAVGARREKHRAALRNKITNELSRKLNPAVFPVRGLDFIPVLDHLWHGAGSGGRPVTWEDYVESRCTILPIML